VTSGSPPLVMRLRQMVADGGPIVQHRVNPGGRQARGAYERRL